MRIAGSILGSASGRFGKPPIRRKLYLPIAGAEGSETHGLVGKEEVTSLADQIHCPPDQEICSLRVGQIQRREFGDTGIGGCPEDRIMHCRIVSNALAIGFLVQATPGITSPPEYRVKADYPLLFLRYVTWPASAFPFADLLLVIGMLGGGPFGTLLDSAFSGAVRHGRRIRVRRLLRDRQG